MRTPEEIARMLGWPAETPLVVGTATIPAEQPVPAPAERPWPRLRVSWEEYANLITDEHRWFWQWKVTDPRGRTLDEGRADGHPEALVVGLAALAAQTAAWVADDPDVVLP